MDTEYIRPRLIYKYHKLRAAKQFDIDFEDVLYEYQAIQEELNASEGEEFEDTLARGRLGMPSVSERISFSGIREQQQHRQGGLLSQYIQMRKASIVGANAPAFGGARDPATGSPKFMDLNRTTDSGDRSNSVQN